MVRGADWPHRDLQRRAAGAGSHAVVNRDRPIFEPVLAFWFGPTPDDPATSKRQARLWWNKDPVQDEDIRRRFGALRRQAIDGELRDWQHTPRGRLALIILVDQFSRNLFRGDPEAFRHDPLARRWADEGIAAGDDRQLRPIERAFFYLPFEHSESLADQERAVALFDALAREAPHADFTDYARRHRDIVARFGRFPHRNAILSRESTPEEIAFLKRPGSSF